MKNVRKTLIFIVCVAMLAPALSFADTEIRDPREAKREATKNAIEERRAEVKESLKATQVRIDEFRGSISKRRIENRTDRSAKLINRMYDNLERLEDITTRTISQTEKMNERGIATEEADEYLFETQILLDSINGDLEDLKAISPVFTSLIQTPAQRDLIKRIDTDMRTVRELLIKSLESLKANTQSQKTLISETKNQ